MTDTNKTILKHVKTAREVMAGQVAARAWIQDLSAAHLLRTQDPIRDIPVTETPADTRTGA